MFATILLIIDVLALFFNPILGGVLIFVEIIAYFFPIYTTLVVVGLAYWVYTYSSKVNNKKTENNKSNYRDSDTYDYEDNDCEYPEEKSWMERQSEYDSGFSDDTSWRVDQSNDSKSSY
jgi:hypothetical protein